jgi:hypothetical protein
LWDRRYSTALVAAPMEIDGARDAAAGGGEDVRRLVAAVLGLGAGLVGAAPASAFTAPELYVRLANANSIDHTPASGWMPLSSTPRLNWLGGYEIGYAFQDAPGPTHVQRAALQVTGVPDGQPTQPRNTPYCSGGPGTIGTIVPVGVAIQFEGVGRYTVAVSVGPPSGGPNACQSGPETATSSGSFTVDVPVSPAVVGHPLSFRAKPLAPSLFSGVQTPAPPGGEADTRCARDATIRSDGSVTGRLLAPPASNGGLSAQVGEQDFVRPGAWTCVARGSARGADANFNDVFFNTPWSAPLRFDVRSDFRRKQGRIFKPRSSRPVLRFVAEFVEAAAGGLGTLQLRRLARCRGSRLVLKTVGTFRGRFDARGAATLKIRRPPAGFYVGTLSFSGTRFYTKSIDPNAPLFAVSDVGELSYVSALLFPQCPGFR